MSARQAMRRIVFLGVTAAIAFAAPVPLESQDQPAEFVHGLKSSGATWQAASDRLRREYRIRPYLPNLSWDRPWSGTFTLMANVYDVDRAPLANSPVSWRSTNVSVATVSGSCVVRLVTVALERLLRARRRAHCVLLRPQTSLHSLALPGEV